MTIGAAAIFGHICILLDPRRFLLLKKCLDSAAFLLDRRRKLVLPPMSFKTVCKSRALSFVVNRSEKEHTPCDSDAVTVIY